MSETYSVSTKEVEETTTEVTTTTVPTTVVTTTAAATTTTKAATTTTAAATTTTSQSTTVSALIQTQRENGCDICGSTSCPSLYAEKWGVAWIDATLCPQYETTLYCTVCGKLEGDGTNGTCNMYLIDTNCTRCGAAVTAMKCHTCS